MHASNRFRAVPTLPSVFTVCSRSVLGHFLQVVSNLIHNRHREIDIE